MLRVKRRTLAFYAIGLLVFTLTLFLVFSPLFTRQAGATVETFSAATSSSWTAPGGVTSVQVECWGSGGAGGGSNSNNAGGGGGGGGGAYAIVSDFTVVPGNSYDYIVGGGGVGVNAASGGNGTSSSFNGTTCVADGGKGGIFDAGAGGAGGDTATSTGDTTYAGGTGAAGTAGGNGPGGGAGSSAGTSTAGNNGSGSTGATAPDTDGGDGGDGGTTGTQVNGLAGSSPGGGGGGALERQGGTTGTGGNGADGQIRLTYIADTEAPLPNPPYFTTVPNATTTSLIRMVSVTVTDATSTPVEYNFTATTSDCAADIGTGGTNSGWQTNPIYNDGGLQSNKCYGYEIAARDSSLNVSATSSASSTYTRAAVPGVITYSAVTPVSITLTNDENGNSTSNPATTFAVYATSTDTNWNDYYLTSGGSTSTSAVWLTDAQIDSLTLNDLQPATAYYFSVKARNADNIETATSSISATSTEADVTAPTPDPPYFTTPPNADAANQISMTSVTVTDDVSAIPQYFLTATTSSCGTEYGPGATNSGWQVGASYIDVGLGNNYCYGYMITTRDDAGNVSATSSASTTYSLAAVPGVLTYSSIDTTTLDLTNDENGNATGTAGAPDTEFAVYATSSDGTWNERYVDSGGNPQTSVQWLTNSQIDGLTVNGLTPNTTYYFSAKARNADNTETASSSVTSVTTNPDVTAPTPNPPHFTTAPNADAANQLAMTSVTVTDDTSSNLEYNFTATTSDCAADFGTGGTNSGWQSGASYTDTSLEVNHCYGYEIAVRDEYGNTTGTSTASTSYTLAAVPGVVTYSAVSGASLTITNNENGNPTSDPITSFAVYSTSTDANWDEYYITAGGSTSTSPVWLTDSQIDGLTLNDLQSDTAYYFSVKARNQDSIETASSTISSTSTLDISAPTPNPPLFEQSSGIPTNASASQIDMTALAASDATPPIDYYFTLDNATCGGDAGTGGTSSGWQNNDNTYSDAGLQANQCYGYKITTRDAVGNVTATSTASTTYSSANVPGELSFANIASSTLEIINDENGNPTGSPDTEFAVYATSSDGTWNERYVDASGNPTVTRTWLTDSEIDNLTLNSLTELTGYSFVVVARNTDNDITASSSPAVATTIDESAPTPSPMTFSTAPNNTAADTINMIATTASDPTPTINYYFTAGTGSCGGDAGTGGTDSSWQTSTTYNDGGLQANKCYSYQVTARDGLSRAGATSSAIDTYTSANTPGAPSAVSETRTSITVSNDENSNPSANPVTTFALFIQSTNPLDASHDAQYIDASGNPSGSEVWLTDAQLDSLQLTTLNSSTTYTMQVKARNADNDETGFSATADLNTAIVVPDLIRIQGTRLQGTRLR